MTCESTAFAEGHDHFHAGFSVHYNPYRNRPADGRYGEWQEGWEYAEDEHQRHQNFEPRHNVVN